MKLFFPRKRGFKLHGLRVLCAAGMFSGILPLTTDLHRTVYHSTSATHLCHRHTHSRLTNQRGEGMNHVFCPQRHLPSVFFSCDPEISLSLVPDTVTSVGPFRARFGSTVRIRFKSRDPPTGLPQFV